MYGTKKIKQRMSSEQRILLATVHPWSRRILACKTSRAMVASVETIPRSGRYIRTTGQLGCIWSSTNNVVIERSFNAPIELIWKMWSDPEHFKAWYGPQGATIPVAEFDVRVGGRRFVGMEMKTPNGAMQMWFTGEHVAVNEPNQLAYSESMSDENGNVQPPSSMGMPEGHPTTTEVRVDLVVTGHHQG